MPYNYNAIINCQICGVSVEALSVRQKYCKPCGVEKDKENKRKWKKNNKEKHNELTLKLKRKQSENLADSYVKQLLQNNGNECTEELIEQKRLQLKIIRKIKTINKNGISSI